MYGQRRFFVNVPFPVSSISKQTNPDDRIVIVIDSFLLLLVEHSSQYFFPFRFDFLFRCCTQHCVGSLRLLWRWWITQIRDKRVGYVTPLCIVQSDRQEGADKRWGDRWEKKNLYIWKNARKRYSITSTVNKIEFEQRNRNYQTESVKPVREPSPCPWFPPK